MANRTQGKTAADYEQRGRKQDAARDPRQQGQHDRLDDDDDDPVDRHDQPVRARPKPCVANSKWQRDVDLRVEGGVAQAQRDDGDQNVVAKHEPPGRHERLWRLLRGRSGPGLGNLAQHDETEDQARRGVDREQCAEAQPHEQAGGNRSHREAEVDRPELQGKGTRTTLALKQVGYCRGCSGAVDVADQADDESSRCDLRHSAGEGE